jgi:diaminopimelate epimerase
MLVQFEKYQGAGNDFIMIDNRSGKYDTLGIDQIKWMCNRHYGIGSDGLILLNESPAADFEMDFYNPDGSKSFCGNGARCVVAFANALGVEATNQTFLAIDGIHEYTLEDSSIGIHMGNVHHIEFFGVDSALMNTGSPHYITLSDDLSTENTLAKGREIRYSAQYKQDGVNVNLVQVKTSHEIDIATYERGVEGETLACGTGATACALFLAFRNELTEGTVIVNAKGGKLAVRFVRNESGFEQIWLLGPASKVFNGEIVLL